MKIWTCKNCVAKEGCELFDKDEGSVIKPSVCPYAKHYEFKAIWRKK